MATLPAVRQDPLVDDLRWQTIGICERAAATVLFAAVSPVLAGCAAAISLMSGRPPLIAHRRVGWRGNTLWMLKLRTMWGHREEGVRHSSWWVEYIHDESGPTQKQAGDPRVPNRFARFCRRYSIDEIPQLWHVIRGEMSLVGPRPLTAAELRSHYGDDVPEVLQAKPGIAGLWQVSGRNRLTYAERRRLDLELVRNLSIRMYLTVLLRAIPQAFTGTDSW